MSLSFPPCQLCNQAPASCRSHIIPRQFYKRVRGTEKHLFELHVESKIERRFTQSGIWEQGILCPTCDSQLGKLDQYAYEVLPEKLVEQRILELGPDVRMYEIGKIDAERFKKFLVSLIWRCSKSTHDMFRFLKVGDFETMLKDILTGKNVSYLDHVDCVIAHLAPPRYDKILLPPFPNECDGVNVAQFYLYPWKLLIKLEERAFGLKFQRATIRINSPTYAFMLNGFSLGELNLLADVQRKIKAFSTAHW